MNPLITLREIHAAEFCDSDWRRLLVSLESLDLDTRISLGDVAQATDARDALWCFRLLDWKDLELRRYTIKHVILPAARRAERHADNKQVRACNDAVERWCDGEAYVDLDAAMWGATAAKEKEAKAAARWAAEAAAKAARTETAAAKAARTETAAAKAAKAEDWREEEVTWAAAAAAAWTAATEEEEVEVAAIRAEAAERALQRADIICAFPLHYLLNKEDNHEPINHIT